MNTRDPVLEAVVNISEGRNPEWLDELVKSTPGCLDLHKDADHHRSVLTLIGHRSELIDAVVDLSESVIADLDLRTHAGVHPRIGLVDVVPFVPVGTSTMDDAITARDDAAARLSDALGLPCFLYGPLDNGTLRTLPEVRRAAFGLLKPDRGPHAPHPRAGAVAVGARDLLVAWNLWLENVDLARARELASLVRSPRVRALGLQVGDATQVSCNLIDPVVATPGDVYDQVHALMVGTEGIARCELVGLAPQRCLEVIDEDRWALLDLDPSTTIEHRAALAGITVL